MDPDLKQAIQATRKHTAACADQALGGDAYAVAEALVRFAAWLCSLRDAGANTAAVGIILATVLGEWVERRAAQAAQAAQASDADG